MSDMSVGNCLVCGRVRYDCACDEPGTSEQSPLRGELASLDEPEKNALWVLGRIDALKSTGLVAGAEVMTPKGVALFDQLDAAGYRPSVRAIRECLADMNGVAESDVPDEMVALVYRYREKNPC